VIVDTPVDDDAATLSDLRTSCSKRSVIGAKT
jgi:hypothetical protein